MPQDPQDTRVEDGPAADPLLGLARKLRLGLEVQNRKVGKKVQRSCFLGGEAVSFLTSRGFTRSRAEGVSVCQRLISSSIIEKVEDEGTSKTAAATFIDNYTFYRFTWDKDEEVSIRLSREASGLYPAGGPPRRWVFAPHTAHNSLVLDAALAAELEESLGSEDPRERLAVIVRLRERVKQVCKMCAPGWAKRGEAVDGRGVRVKSYRRSKPIGDFRSRKTVGVVPVSPRQFLLSFFDLREGRRCWEPCYAQGAVLEEIEVPEDEGSVLLATPRCLRRGRQERGQSSAASLAPAAERAKELWPAPCQEGEEDGVLWESGTTEEGRASRSSSSTLPVVGGPETDRTRSLSSLSSFPCLESPFVEGGAGEEGGDVLLLAATAAGMSVARFDDPAHQQVIHHIAANLLDLDTSCCGACGKDVGGPTVGEGRRSGLVMCMCCGILACVACCSREVFDAARRDVVRVCDHCFRFSSRIDHPKRTSHTTEDGHPSWASERKAEETHDRRSAEEENEERRVKDRIEGTMDKMDQYDAQCSRAYRQSTSQTAKKGQPPSSVSTPEDYAALRIKVPPSFPPPGSSHTTASNSNSDSSDGRPQLVHPHSSAAGAGPPLTGLPQVQQQQQASTRIVHRKATSPAPALVQPREACVLQDAFCDEQGTVYVYEISVQHVDALPSPSHVSAEVLFLCYSAKALPPAPHTPAGRPTAAASILTVISQVDAQSTLPTWMNRLAADRGRYGLFGGHDIYPQQPIPPCPPPDEEEIGSSFTPHGAGMGHAAPALGKQTPGAPTPQGLGARLFDLVSVIGRGGFGKVYLVRQKTNRRLFAMKVLKKSELRQRNQIERTRTERKVMAGLEHPFIVRLHYAFHTPARVYMVMDFCQGGDLFTLMRRVGCMDEQGARVLGAEMALALQHLHDRDIVYRDLKPENVLLGADGHVKLTDFGLCRYFEVRPPQSPAAEGAPLRAAGSWEKEGDKDVDHSPLAKFVTHSFCGTEEYMAPEVLLNQGHGSAVDWWCLGLCLHEMMARRHPFKGASHIDTLRNICAMDPCLESGLSSEAQQCMDQLLRKNPQARVHCLPMLQRQPFFQHHLDWDDVYHKRLPPPFVPRLRGEEDTASFSTLYTADCIRDSEVTVAGRRGMGRESGTDRNQGESGGCFNFVPFTLGLDGSYRGASKGFEDDFEGFDYIAPAETSARAGMPPACHRSSKSSVAPGQDYAPAVNQVDL